MSPGGAGLLTTPPMLQRYFTVDDLRGTLAYSKSVTKKPSVVLPLTDITKATPPRWRDAPAHTHPRPLTRHDSSPSRRCNPRTSLQPTPSPPPLTQSLPPISQIEAADLESCHGASFPFVVSCPPVHLVLAAEDRQDQRLWITGLQKRVQLWRDKQASGPAAAAVAVNIADGNAGYVVPDKDPEPIDLSSLGGAAFEAAREALNMWEKQASDSGSEKAGSLRPAAAETEKARPPAKKKKKKTATKKSQEPTGDDAHHTSREAADATSAAEDLEGEDKPSGSPVAATKKKKKKNKKQEAPIEAGEDGGAGGPRSDSENETRPLREHSGRAASARRDADAEEGRLPGRSPPPRSKSRALRSAGEAEYEAEEEREPPPAERGAPSVSRPGSREAACREEHDYAQLQTPPREGRAIGGGSMFKRIASPAAKAADEPADSASEDEDDAGLSRHVVPAANDLSSSLRPRHTRLTPPPLNSARLRRPRLCPFSRPLEELLSSDDDEPEDYSIPSHVPMPERAVPTLDPPPASLLGTRSPGSAPPPPPPAASPGGGSAVSPDAPGQRTTPWARNDPLAGQSVGITDDLGSTTKTAADEDWDDEDEDEDEEEQEAERSRAAAKVASAVNGDSLEDDWDSDEE